MDNLPCWCEKEHSSERGAAFKGVVTQYVLGLAYSRLHECCGATPGQQFQTFNEFLDTVYDMVEELASDLCDRGSKPTMLGSLRRSSKARKDEPTPVWGRIQK